MSQFAKVSARTQIRELQKCCDGLTILTQVFLNRLGDSVTVTNAELSVHHEVYHSGLNGRCSTNKQR